MHELKPQGDPGCATAEAAALPSGFARCHTAGDPALEYLIARPSDPARLPLLVAVHGIGRRATGMAEAFSTAARNHGFALVAPLFDDAVFDDYQRLGRGGRGARADLALLQLIDELAVRGDIDPKAVVLVGYSGGAQFAHRFAFAHPDRVAGAVIASAGWYQWPVSSTPYPYGSAASDDLLGIEFEPDRFLRVPLLVVAGTRDTQRDHDLRQNEYVDRVQGRTRLARAQRFVAAVREQAQAHGLPPRAEFRELTDAGHSLASSIEAGLASATVTFAAEVASRIPSSSPAAAAPKPEPLP